MRIIPKIPAAVIFSWKNNMPHKDAVKTSVVVRIAAFPGSTYFRPIVRNMYGIRVETTANAIIIKMQEGELEIADFSPLKSVKNALPKAVKIKVYAVITSGGYFPTTNFAKILYSAYERPESKPTKIMASETGVFLSVLQSRKQPEIAITRAAILEIVIFSPNRMAESTITKKGAV